MRILIFSLTYHPFVGGAEIAVKGITDRIAPGEIVFDMITLRLNNALPKVEKIGNITVYRIGWAIKNPSYRQMAALPLYLIKVFYPVLALFKAMTLYRKNHYDGFWAMMSYMGFPIVLFRMFYKKVPYALTLQEGDSLAHITKRTRIRAVYPLFKKIFTDAAVVQVISTYLGRFARGMGFKGPLEVIPNGVDTAAFARPVPKEELAILERVLHKEPNDIFLIGTSRLVEKNAWDVLTRALAHLPERVKLLAIGTGPLERSLRLQAQKGGVADRVMFLGHVEYADIPKYLSIADIFVRPSRSEGMGNSFIEAMAAGVPVIGTQEGGIADFLFDPERDPDKPPTGLAVPVDDPQAVVRAVGRYLSDESLRNTVVRNARAFIRDRYDWNTIAQNMKEKVFARILKNYDMLT